MSLVHLLGRPARSCAKLLPKASGITCISNTSSASAVQLASARFASVLAAPKRAAHTRSWSSYLLFLPSGVAAFLTYWQYQRMQWKQRLIDDATAALQQPPVNAFTADELPHQRRAVAEGFYQHARSVCVGPRTRSAGPVTVKGCTLITPLHNPETKRTILVNRGFVPNEWAQDAAMRAKGQPSARVCEVCVAQESENPSAVVPANRPATKEFFWIDVPAIAEACGLPPATPLIQVGMQCTAIALWRAPAGSWLQ